MKAGVPLTAAVFVTAALVAYAVAADMLGMTLPEFVAWGWRLQ